MRGPRAREIETKLRLRTAQTRDEAQVTVRRVTGELADLAERAAAEAEKLLVNARRATLASHGRAALPRLHGIARSDEEAREGLTMAVRQHLDTPLVPAEPLLIYRVLLRDQPAITDLVHTVLGQLVHARGGAEALLAILDAYFAIGGVATETARRLHLSVRAVSYRLDRIKTLTGYDPIQRFTINTAVLGANSSAGPNTT